MKAYHICYHIDEDGNASAAIIYEFLKRQGIKYKEKTRYFFYRIDYTMNLETVLPDIPLGDEAYFVDYSFSDKNNLEYLMNLLSKGIHVTWIDHHKTSYGIIMNLDLDNYQCGHLHHFINTDYCAAYLCYIYAYFSLQGYSTNYLHGLKYPEYIPLYIRYVDSWDTWKHNMDNTIEFNIGMRSMNRTPRSVFSSMFKYKNDITSKLFSDNEHDIEVIESYMQHYIKNTISRGKVIKAYQDISNESLCSDYGFEFYISDESNKDTRVYHCFALNKRGNSTMFGTKINEYDIVVPFQFNGEQYIYSLYTSKEDINCESLAKKLGSIDGLGGGGHTKAAGFQTYNQIIKSNCTVHITSKLFNKNKYNIFTAVHNK